jgi:hypothetical protein
MKTYLMEDDMSASLLSLEQTDDRIEGTIVEATWSGGMPFEVTGQVGGYVREGRLQILVISDPGSPDFTFTSDGSIDEDEVVLTRGNGEAASSSVVFRRGSMADYRRAVARIAAREAARRS